MKIKIRPAICFLILTVYLVSFTVSCKKDETISKKDPVITWANPADISFGTLLSATQLNATADVPGTFVYTPAVGTTLTTGMNQDLKVDFAPTDATNYNPASKTVKINVVAKKDPVITWANPADISYGTLLSATQLNATADVSGTFIYTPAVGTILNEGANQNLKVDFTPTDISEYNTVSKTVTINVNAPVPVTVTDTSGNVYHTITLGSQTWMIENLKTTKYNDGTDIPLVTVATDWAAMTTPAFCWYKNDEANYGATCGALYNWYAVNSGKLCPKGWHVPTDDEWTVLETYLIFNAYNFDGTTAGNKYAKALASTSNWDPSPNEGAVGNTDFPAKRNVTNFTGVPAGCRAVDGGFAYYTFYAFWWSTSLNDASSVWDRGLYSHSNYVARSSYGFRNGFSVRCLKD